MNDLIHWLALHHALGGTPRTLRSLLESCGPPQEILQIHQKNPTYLKLTPLQHQRLHKIDYTLIEDDLRWQQNNSTHHIITLADPRYPPDLKEIYDPPIVLYVKGQPEHLLKPQLAIVGSRNATLAGEEIAYQFAHQLSLAGLIITSGMALGIDYHAHCGALAAHMPTIAVLGCGNNIIYPKKHTKMASEVALSGAIISEQPVNTPVIADNFPKRNRIISGLSLGTLVIEASLKSGSLITARLANEQGREVFAIPGALKNPLARGCHYLIKNGAKLTEHINDILDEIGFDLSAITEEMEVQPLKDLDPLDNKLIECLGFCVQSAQNLINPMGVSAKELSSRLLNLELRGYIKAVPGGYCRVSHGKTRAK